MLTAVFEDITDAQRVLLATWLVTYPAKPRFAIVRDKSPGTQRPKLLK
jgi:hypothetical protein